MNKAFLTAAAILLAGTTLAGAYPAPDSARPRVIVLTDGEVDDRCSMVHFLLCSCDFDVEAIIQSNSCFQRKGWSTVGWLEKEIDDYARVYPRLKIHNPAYPEPEALRRICLVGDEDPAHVEGHGVPDRIYPGAEPRIDPAAWVDTPGSDRIVEVLLDKDPRKVYILAWGGGNTAAKAFQKLKDCYPRQYEQAVSKAVMYNIWYQDGAGSYIEKNHPAVTMLLSHRFTGTWDYGSQRYTDSFVKQYLRGESGTLAANYVQDYISEGDSPSFFHMMANGLRSFEEPSFGGYGGAFFKSPSAPNTYLDSEKGSYTRWTEYVNRDFEARLRWCTAETFEAANHHPVAAIRQGLSMTVRSGDTVTLEGILSDPDPYNADVVWADRHAVFEQGGMTREKFDEMFVHISRAFPPCSGTWWQFYEAGTYPGHVELIPGKDNTVSFIAPAVSKQETLHIILEVKDQGAPSLSSFARMVITVLP